MNKRLELIFENVEGKNVTLSIDDPIEPADPALIIQATDTIINHNTFFSSGGNLVAKKGARIVARSTEEISLPL